MVDPKVEGATKWISGTDLNCVARTPAQTASLAPTSVSTPAFDFSLAAISTFI